MTVENRPVVRLYRNPWSATMTNYAVLQTLHFAATQGSEKLQRMVVTGEVQPGSDTYAAVILDPTRPRDATTLDQRVLAVIGLGSNWQQYVPDAAAMADAHDRHGVDNSTLIEDASHCLGNGDTALGGSVVYRYAICGGAGLTVTQNADLAFLILKRTMDGIRDLRDRWNKAQRLTGNGRWYNPFEAPGLEYKGLLDQLGYSVLAAEEDKGVLSVKVVDTVTD